MDYLLKKRYKQSNSSPTINVNNQIVINGCNYLQNLSINHKKKEKKYFKNDDFEYTLDDQQSKK